MKQILIPSALIFLLSVFTLGSCKKDKKSDDPVVEEPGPTPTVPGQTGSLKLEFTNTVDGQALVLGTSYTNPGGESFTVSKFKYFISNVVLTKSDNSDVTLQNVYQIIDQAADTSRTMVLKNVPLASYKSIRFILGVDSARNRSGAQSGGLDVVYANDMYWNWNQGYIFLKMEGTAPTSTLSTNGVEYHIGGFGGVNKTQRAFGFHFAAEAANVTASTTPTISFVTNLNELFKTPNAISFASSPVILSTGSKAKSIADNYSDMITFGSIKN